LLFEGRKAAHNISLWLTVFAPWSFLDRQERVVKAAVAGASIFITGIAGSGKTHVLDKIIKLLKDLHGVGCQHLHDLTKIEYSAFLRL